MRVSELIEDSALMRKLKAKVLSWTRLAGTGAPVWWDVAAMAVLLGWFCSLVYVQRFHQSFVGTDQIIRYFPDAQRFLEGYGPRSFAPEDPVGPGYPLMLGLATVSLPGGMFAAGKMVGVLSSTLFLFLTYLLLRRVFSRATALASLLMVMGVNSFGWISCANGSDLPFAFLAMASFYFTGRHDRPTRLDAIVAGLTAGLATTVRLPGLVLPLFMCARLALALTDESRTRSRIELLGLYLLAFALTSGPWFYLSYRLQGNVWHIRGTIGLDPSILPPSASLLSATRQALGQEPLAFAGRSLQKLLGGLPEILQGLNTYPRAGGWVMAGPFWVLVVVGLLFIFMQIDRLKLWFLLSCSIWWASLVPIHYEARYYALLIPAFSALAVSIFTSNSLPDIRVTAGQGRWAKFTRGYLWDQVVCRRVPAWLIPNRSAGASLASLALIGILIATAFTTVQRVRGGYRWKSEQYGFYHELARLVERLQGPGLHRPIGARQWSQARYWIPHEAGTAVAPLPGRDYESLLPDLSYVLYDQINDDDTLVGWWDDPRLSALADPLHAPPNLEAVYYKPDPYRAILYRILEQNDPAEIVSASASSALPGHSAAEAFDNDSETWWSSGPGTDEDAFPSLTLDLGRPTPINHVWLLPRAGGEAFPAGLAIAVSQDGETWQPVVEAKELPQPIRQSPQTFSFRETAARLVRITATQLSSNAGEEGYLASLAEVRISLAIERPSELPMFSIAPTDLLFDPLSNELVARVHNETRVPGQATVDFYLGWSAEDAEYLATVSSPVTEPARVGVARLSTSERGLLEPGHCRPIWATVKPPYPGDMKLDTYGVVTPQPRKVYNLVCSPQQVVIDDFDYLESPLVQGWVVVPDQTATGEVTTTYDRDLGRRVMRISSDAEYGFAISRRMSVYGRPILSLWIKALSNFIVYVQVRDTNGQHYYIQYMPHAWPDYPEEFPEGRYLYYPLGSHLADGTWHKLERDVGEDLASKTSREVDYVEAVSFRSYDELGVAAPELDVRE